MFETKDGDVNWVAVIIAGFVIIAIVGGMIAFSLKVQHDVVNPAVRQNLVDDPQRSIDVRNGFHTKLAEIISADNNISALINQMKQYRASHPDWQNDNYYAQLELQLSGNQQIRSSAIADYNAYADNPDNGKFRDSWLPAQIDTQPLPADEESMLRTLSNEILTLSTANSRAK